MFMAFYSNSKRILVIVFGVALVLGLLVALFAAVSPNAAEAPEDASAAEPIEVNEEVYGIYTGTLPCADCEGIETELTLTARNGYTTIGRYTLSETYLGKTSEPFVVTGEWVVDMYEGEEYDVPVYILYDEDGNETGRHYLALDDETLVLLSTDGELIESDLPYELARQ